MTHLTSNLPAFAATAAPRLLRITTVDLSLATLLTGQMRFMREKGMQVIMISADTGYRERVMATEGCPHITIPLQRQIAFWQDLRCLWLMIKTIRYLRPDIVHAQTSKAGLLAMLAARITGVPIRIQTVGGTPPDLEQNWLKRLILSTTEKITFWAATQVWPNSYSLREFILEHRYAPAHKLTVIGHGSSNGIDLNRFSRTALDPVILQTLQDSLQPSPNRIYFLFVGRLLRDKGIIELVEAFLNRAGHHAHIRLLVLGNVETHRSPLPETTLKTLKTHPQIILIPWSDQVEYYMALAHYLIHPSHREGFPNVLLQAGAMQLPILAADVVGNRDCIQHQQTGYLFTARQAPAIEAAIQFALDHPTLMQQYAHHWLTKITTQFNRPCVQQAYYEQYTQLLEAAFKTHGYRAKLSRK